MTHCMLKTRGTEQKNSLDRRDRPREKQTAQIFTLNDSRGFESKPVIECSERGARVVLHKAVRKDQKLGIVVQANGRRTRTTARVAWTSPLCSGMTVVGLEFTQTALCLAS